MARLDLQALSDETPLHRSLQLRIRRTEEGVDLEAQVGDEFVVDTHHGTVHGGIVATLLDVAATFALIAATGHDWVTVDLRVDYLRPLPAGPAVATGRILRAGRTVGRAQATLTDAAGSLCAAAVGTFAPGGEPAGSSRESGSAG